jgi:hypothetical protein
MNGVLSLDKIAVLFLTLISVGVGIGIIYSVDSEGQSINPVEDSVRNSDYPICSGFEKGQEVDKKDFRTLTYARYLEACDKESNNITLLFKLDKEYLSNLASDLSENPKIIYREDCSNVPGLQGIVVEDTGSNIISTYGDNVILNGTKPPRLCKS